MCNKILNDFRKFVFTKRLPTKFGRGSIYVTPRADARVIYPGWLRCANDLMIVAQKNIGRDAVVWDIGANLGIFSAFSAGMAGPNGRVYAMEPDPYYANLISRSAERLNDSFSPISVLCAAMSNEFSIADFIICPKGSAKSSLASTGRNKGGAVRSVVTVTMDSMLEYWPRPDFVKIDVEGGEISLLSGANALLQKVRPILYIEISDENSVAGSQIFKEMGYDTYRLNSGDETQTERPGMYTMARPR